MRNISRRGSLVNSKVIPNILTAGAAFIITLF